VYATFPPRNLWSSKRFIPTGSKLFLAQENCSFGLWPQLWLIRIRGYVDALGGIELTRHVNLTEISKLDVPRFNLALVCRPSARGEGCRPRTASSTPPPLRTQLRWGQPDRQTDEL
jgi:hypothetical protein